MGRQRGEARTRAPLMGEFVPVTLCACYPYTGKSFLNDSGMYPSFGYGSGGTAQSAGTVAQATCRLYSLRDLAWSLYLSLVILT